MTDSIRVAIVGSTGYGGVELIRLLHQHPKVEITSVLSSSSAGTPITEGYPHLQGIREDVLDPIEIPTLKEKADIVFTATPSGVSTSLVPGFLEAGLKVIDLAGDFRLTSPEVYERWYKHKAPDPAYLQKAVYGLSEVFGEEVKGAQFVTNPGCYPTAALLGLIPALEAGWIDPDTLIIDGKSGVSGAGRGVSLAVHYAEVNESLKAYKVNKHQHIPEIEQVLSRIAGRTVVTTFTTHLVPMTRGILDTMYAKINGAYGEEDFIRMYREYYKNRPFVRVRDKGTWPATKEVWGSNYCDIGFSVDERTGRVTILSAIDNVMKGAAGQAVQNLNLMMGWDETLGLGFVPVYP